METGSSTTGGGRGLIGAAIVVAALIVSASIIYARYVPPHVTTSTTTSVTISTVTATETVTRTSTYTEDILESACSQAAERPEASPYPNLTVAAGEPALLCLRVYYFNSNATYDLNVTRALEVFGIRYTPGAQPTEFSGASNFTIESSPDELTVGGPNDLNEGAMFGYALVANPGASGSYEIGFNEGGYVLGGGAIGPEQCGAYGEIIAGSGQPSYLFQGFSGCITYGAENAATTNSTKWTVVFVQMPGVSFQMSLMNRTVYFVIEAYTNSNEIGSIG